MDSSQEMGLIAQAVAGDALAMQRLLQMHRKRILAYVRAQIPASLRATVDAEDVVQECFFDACRQFTRFAALGDDCVFRWLAAIARNHLISLLRRQHALKRGGEDQGDHELVQTLEELAIHRRTPSKSVARRELLAAVEQAIERLPENYRAAVTLRYVEGLCIAEVAARIGRSEGAASMLIMRGLKALRTDLKSKSYYV